MTEATHQSQERISSPHIDGAPSYMQIDAIEKLRYEQYAALNDALQQTDNWREFNTDDERRICESLVDELLRSNGLSEDDSEYADAKNILMEASIFSASDKQWRCSNDENGTYNESRRERTYEAIRCMYSIAEDKTDELDESDEDPRLNNNMTSEKWDEVDADLEEVIAEYAKKISNRSKSMIERAKNRNAINELKEEATDLVNGIATNMMDDLESQGKSVSEIATAIDQFVNEQMNALMSAMEDHRQDEYEKSSPVMKFVYDKWAKWTEQGTDESGKEKFLTKGRMKKLAATAIPAAAIAVPVGLLAPAIVGVGTVAAIAGGAGLVFKSIGRKLAGGFLDKKASQTKLAQTQSEDMKREYERSIAESEVEQRKTIFEVADEYSQYYRKKNLRRTMTGVALAGTVGLISTTGAQLLTDRLDVVDFERPVNWLKDKFGIGDTNARYDADADNDGILDPLYQNDGNGGTAVDTPETSGGGSGAEDHSDLVGDTSDDMNEVTVEAGHGYTHELIDFATANGQELSPKQAYALHLDLVKKFGEDYIDVNGISNDVYHQGADIRLSEPGNGQWQKGVPEFTAKWMNDHNLWKSAA